MGQYYIIVNFDKKEYFSPDDFGGGLKLMEFAYEYNRNIKGPVDFLEYLIKTTWSGHQIAVLGDYVEKGDSYDGKDSYWKEYIDYQYSKMLLYGEDETASLYNVVKGTFKNIGFLGMSDFEPDRYIINKELRQYFDREHAPINSVFIDEGKEYVERVSALPILICAGNGLGSGDYHRDNGKEYIGSWLSTSDSINFSNEVPEGYMEIMPDFIDDDEVIPYAEKERLLEKARKEGE